MTQPRPATLAASAGRQGSASSGLACSACRVEAAPCLHHPKNRSCAWSRAARSACLQISGRRGSLSTGSKCVLPALLTGKRSKRVSQLPSSTTPNPPPRPTALLLQRRLQDGLHGGRVVLRVAGNGVEHRLVGVQAAQLVPHQRRLAGACARGRRGRARWETPPDVRIGEDSPTHPPTHPPACPPVCPPARPPACPPPPPSPAFPTSITWCLLGSSRSIRQEMRVVSTVGTKREEEVSGE